MKPRKIAKRKAIQWLAKKEGCSYTVAAHILNCKSTEARKRIIDGFDNRIRK